MTALDKRALALSRKYTDETVEGGGAIKGKNCTIKSIERDGLDNIVTFLWTLDNGTEKTDIMRVPGGETGRGIVAISQRLDLSEIEIQYTDGTKDTIAIPTIQGEPGFSPEIEVAENTEDSYKLKITTEKDEFTTPNLKGSSGNYSELENKPTLNGAVLQGDMTSDDIGIQEISQAELTAMWNN